MLSLVALCLVGHIDASHFAGALTEEEDLSGVPVSELTREQLLSEQKRLEPYRTSFIAPVVLTAVGGVLLIGGAAFTIVGIFYVYLPALFGGGSSTVGVLTLIGGIFAAIGVAALITGGVLLTIGLVKLFPALARRREAGERRDEIQKRLEQLDAPPPPPPPLNPGDVRYQGPTPSLVLATF